MNLIRTNQLVNPMCVLFHTRWCQRQTWVIFVQCQQHITFLWHIHTSKKSQLVALTLEACQPCLSLFVYLFTSLLPLSLSVSPVLVIQFHLSLWKPLSLVAWTCSAVFLLSLQLSCLTCQKFLQFVWTFCQVTISLHYFHCDLDLSCDISFDTHEFKQLCHFWIWYFSTKS